MTSHDFLFYTFSLVSVGAALGSALRADLRGAATASLATGAALAVLLGLAAAPVAATLVGACVFAGHAIRHRAAYAAEPAIDAASTLTSRLRTAALLLAFFVIAARAVLIVRWPLAKAAVSATAAGVSSVALAHYLLVALALLTIGLFAAITRRSVAGVALGLATASGAAVLALAAASRFVGANGEAAQLAAVVVAITAAAGLATERIARGCSELLRSSEVAWRVAGSLSTVVAGVTLALLATAW